ncbi:MAG: hypothetical protein IPM04_00510 [Saprospiraceae bacterium]|nr:hypothetical protein [Candidatus Brachybacter algidus]MBK8746365.1 hypothetical protein [Candidatus Brachybacter algidus]
MDLNSRYDIGDYIHKLLNFTTQADCNVLLFPYFNFNGEEIKAIKYAEKQKMDFFITSNFIALGRKETNIWGFDYWSKEHYEEFDHEISKTLSNLLEKIMKSDFSTLIDISKENYESKDELIIKNNDLNYLNWAIENVADFAIYPSFLEKHHEIKIIKTFEINRLNDYIFEYRPVYLSTIYAFPSKSRTINLNKFCKLNNVVYDSKLNAYVPNLSEVEMNKSFEYYLNENYYGDDFAHKNKRAFYREPYDGNGYSGNWLEDAAGSNDPEVMNDAYWNMD